jgi:phage-related protein
MLSVVFYRTETGNEPVRDWLRSLDDEARRHIGDDLLTVQYGWPLGMPLCRSLGNGLYEVRTELAATRRIARVLFFQAGSDLIVVEGFIKKSQRTPTMELATAKRRKGEYERKARELAKRTSRKPPTK